MAKTMHALVGLRNHQEAVVENGSWVYLRLFYTETAMSWQDTDFWYFHMGFSFSLASLAGFVILVVVRYFTPSTKRHLDNWAVAAICLITIPAFTALVFMIGKYSLFPPKVSPQIPSWTTLSHYRNTHCITNSHQGVFKMNKHGCCTQALLFPREEIPALAKYLGDIGLGQTDMMIENYADETRKDRLALAPQQVQHVGLQSSRDNTLMNAMSTWAFWFEEYDAEKLRREHLELTGG